MGKQIEPCLLVVVFGPRVMGLTSPEVKMATLPKRNLSASTPPFLMRVLSGDGFGWGESAFKAVGVNYLFKSPGLVCANRGADGPD